MLSFTPHLIFGIKTTQNIASLLFFPKKSIKTPKNFTFCCILIYKYKCTVLRISYIYRCRYLCLLIYKRFCIDSKRHIFPSLRNVTYMFKYVYIYATEIKQTFKQGNVLKEDHINPVSLIFDFIFVSLLPLPSLIYFILFLFIMNVRHDTI